MNKIIIFTILVSRFLVKLRFLASNSKSKSNVLSCKFLAGNFSRTELVHKDTGGAISAKYKRNGGKLTYFFNLKVYPTNYMPFLFDNFCRLLGFGGTNPLSPPHGAGTV